jgi:hypothetical protein
MKKIMTEAVAVANATSRAMLWDERNKDEFLYKDSYWSILKQDILVSLQEPIMIPIRMLWIRFKKIPYSQT